MINKLLDNPYWIKDELSEYFINTKDTATAFYRLEWKSAFCYSVLNAYKDLGKIPPYSFYNEKLKTNSADPTVIKEMFLSSFKVMEDICLYEIGTAKSYETRSEKIDTLHVLDQNNLKDSCFVLGLSDYYEKRDLVILLDYYKNIKQ